MFSALGKIPVYNNWFITNAKGLIIYVLYILVFYLKCHIYQNCSCYLIYSILLIGLHQLLSKIYKIDLLVFSSIVQTYHYWSDQVCLTCHCQY